MPHNVQHYANEATKVEQDLYGFSYCFILFWRKVAEFLTRSYACTVSFCQLKRTWPDFQCGFRTNSQNVVGYRTHRRRWVNFLWLIPAVVIKCQTQPTEKSEKFDPAQLSQPNHPTNGLCSATKSIDFQFPKCLKLNLFRGIRAVYIFVTAVEKPNFCDYRLISSIRRRFGRTISV